MTHTGTAVRLRYSTRVRCCWNPVDGAAAGRQVAAGVTTVPGIVSRQWRTQPAGGLRELRAAGSRQNTTASTASRGFLGRQGERHLPARSATRERHPRDSPFATRRCAARTKSIHAAAMHRPDLLFAGGAQSAIAETEPVHGWLPNISSPRESGSAQCVAWASRPQRALVCASVRSCLPPVSADCVEAGGLKIRKEPRRRTALPPAPQAFGARVQQRALLRGAR